MESSILLSRDEAQRYAFRSDRVLPLKLVLGIALLYLFYAEHFWRVGLLLLAGLRCSFITPCVVDGSSAGQISLVLLGRLMLIAGVSRYVEYTFAWLSYPASKTRALGVLAVFLFPFAYLGAGLLVAALTIWLGLPVATILDFETRNIPSWMPPSFGGY